MDHIRKTSSPSFARVGRRLKIVLLFFCLLFFSVCAVVTGGFIASCSLIMRGPWTCHHLLIPVASTPLACRWTLRLAACPRLPGLTSPTSSPPPARGNKNFLSGSWLMLWRLSKLFLIVLSPPEYSGAGAPTWPPPPAPCASTSYSYTITPPANNLDKWPSPWWLTLTDCLEVPVSDRLIIGVFCGGQDKFCGW